MAHLFGPEQYSILPDEIVDMDTLPMLIDRAERAVLDRYSVVEDDATVVKLRGYDADPQEMDAELLTRLRYVVADVIEHGANRPDPNVESTRRGARSVTFRSVIASMPQSSFRLLDDYDEREPLWRV